MSRKRRVSHSENHENTSQFRGFGVGIWFELPRLFELTSHLTEISDVALNLESFGSCRAPQHNVHPLGLYTLNPRQQVRIEAKLNQRGRLGGACELGFNYLVRPRPECAGLVDPNK